MEYTFKASRGMTIQIITIGVIILFVFIGYKSILGIITSNGDLRTILLHSSILVLLFGTLLFCYLFAPQKYSIKGNEFIIHRPIFDKYFAIDSIKEIRQLDKSELKGMIRTFGVGGLFGSYGKFYNQTLGNVTMYATQNKNYIIILRLVKQNKN